jgi:hypothetical protein
LISIDILNKPPHENVEVFFCASRKALAGLKNKGYPSAKCVDSLVSGMSKLRTGSNVVPVFGHFLFVTMRGLFT